MPEQHSPPPTLLRGLVFEGGGTLAAFSDGRSVLVEGDGSAFAVVNEDASVEAHSMRFCPSGFRGLIAEALQFRNRFVEAPCLPSWLVGRRGSGSSPARGSSGGATHASQRSHRRAEGPRSPPGWYDQAHWPLAFDPRFVRRHPDGGVEVLSIEGRARLRLCPLGKRVSASFLAEPCRADEIDPMWGFSARRPTDRGLAPSLPPDRPEVTQLHSLRRVPQCFEAAGRLAVDVFVSGGSLALAGAPHPPASGGGSGDRGGINPLPPYATSLLPATAEPLTPSWLLVDISQLGSKGSRECSGEGSGVGLRLLPAAVATLARAALREHAAAMQHCGGDAGYASGRVEGAALDAAGSAFAPGLCWEPPAYPAGATSTVVEWTPTATYLLLLPVPGATTLAVEATVHAGGHGDCVVTLEGAYFTVTELAASPPPQQLCFLEDCALKKVSGGSGSSDCSGGGGAVNNLLASPEASPETERGGFGGVVDNGCGGVRERCFHVDLRDAVCGGRFGRVVAVAMSLRAAYRPPAPTCAQRASRPALGPASRAWGGYNDHGSDDDKDDDNEGDDGDGDGVGDGRDECAGARTPQGPRSPEKRRFRATAVVAEERLPHVALTAFGDGSARGCFEDRTLVSLTPLSAPPPAPLGDLSVLAGEVHRFLAHSSHSSTGCPPEGCSPGPLGSCVFPAVDTAQQHMHLGRLALSGPSAAPAWRCTVVTSTGLELVAEVGGGRRAPPPLVAPYIRVVCAFAARAALSPAERESAAAAAVHASALVSREVRRNALFVGLQRLASQPQSQPQSQPSAKPAQWDRRDATENRTEGLPGEGPRFSTWAADDSFASSPNASGKENSSTAAGGEATEASEASSRFPSPGTQSAAQTVPHGAHASAQRGVGSAREWRGADGDVRQSAAASALHRSKVMAQVARDAAARGHFTPTGL